MSKQDIADARLELTDRISELLAVLATDEDHDKADDLVEMMSAVADFLFEQLDVQITAVDKGGIHLTIPA